MHKSEPISFIMKGLIEETVGELLQKEDLAFYPAIELGDAHFTVLPHLHLKEKRIVVVAMVSDEKINDLVKDSVRRDIL